jgi:hypothetical protein
VGSLAEMSTSCSLPYWGSRLCPPRCEGRPCRLDDPASGWPYGCCQVVLCYFLLLPRWKKEVYPLGRVVLT